MLTKNMLSTEQKSCIENTLEFRTSRSGGSGGQHVNKVSSKVELIWDLNASLCIEESQRVQLKKNLGHRLLADGTIRIISQKGRSQLQNKTDAVFKFFELLEAGLLVHAIRKPTKVPKAVLKKRKEDKLLKAYKKFGRKKIDLRNF